MRPRRRTCAPPPASGQLSVHVPTTGEPDCLPGRQIRDRLLRTAKDATQHRLLHVLQWRAVLVAATMPDTFGIEVETARFIACRAVQYETQVGLCRRLGDLNQRFHATVEVAVHQIGRADPELLLATVTEAQDP